jgi:hypothetical protein
MSTDSERGAIIKVYRLPSSNLSEYGNGILFWWVAFGFTIQALLSAFTALGRDITSALAVVVAGILTLILNSQVRLVIREHGIEYHSFLNVILGRFRPALFSTWANLSHIDVVASSDGDGAYYEYHLNLHHSFMTSITIGKIIPMKHHTYSTGRWFSLSKRHFICLDMEHLLNSSFGSYLEKYAPQVIEAAALQQKKIEDQIREIELSNTRNRTL